MNTLFFFNEKCLKCLVSIPFYFELLQFLTEMEKCESV